MDAPSAAVIGHHCRQLHDLAATLGRFADWLSAMDLVGSLTDDAKRTIEAAIAVNSSLPVASPGLEDAINAAVEAYNRLQKHHQFVAARINAGGTVIDAAVALVAVWQSPQESYDNPESCTNACEALSKSVTAFLSLTRDDPGAPQGSTPEKPHATRHNE